MQDPSAATIKAELRRAALARRNSLSDVERATWSAAIAERAAGLVAKFKPACASFYWPIGSECDTKGLIEATRSAGAEIVLPAVVDNERIVFRVFVAGMALVPGGFGTSVPSHDAREIAPDLIVVPLVAFDRQGTRLGYGRGHYDRAITALREAGQQPKLLGIAFSVQEVETIPAEAHDVHLEWIVTEKEVLALRPDKD